MATKIAQNLIDQVTEEQVARCFRFEIELPGGKTEVRYAVQSESNPDVEYLVTFTPGKGFSCTCPAGQENFYYCSQGTCKHCRWAVAHARMYRKEQVTIARNERIAQLESLGLTYEEAVMAVDSNAIINGKPATDAELVKVYGAGRPSEAEIEAWARMEPAQNPRPFAILR